MSQASRLEIIPLGGLGEFGMNLMVYRWGSDCLVVDAGMMFPGQEHLGVEVVIPDLSFLDECGTIHAVILTHGHEDHIGALSYLLARHDVPVYATPYTEGLVRRRLTEHEMLDGAELRRLPDAGVDLRFGPFTVETVDAAHSIPQAKMLVLRTPAGILVHTADFKMDPDPPGGIGTDLGRLAEIGREGVLALLSDSTNANLPGSTPGERSVGPGISAAVAACDGRVIVTTFASHIFRLRQLLRIAIDHGRRVAFVGRSIEAHADVAEGLGLLAIPPGLRVEPDELTRLAPRETLVIGSGSQGEPLSAMSRISVGKHRHVVVEPGDLVLHSAREIPGNEKGIARMINHFLRRGAEVVTAADAPIHVSGHASSDELRCLLNLLRPKYLIPIHGEYRQLQAHARLAVDAGMEPDCVQLADSGDVIVVDDRRLAVEDQVHVGQVLIDASLDEVDREILKDRRRIAGGGIVVPVVAVHRESGAVNGFPEIMTRGFVPNGEQPDEELMREARHVVAESLREATPEERADEGLLRARIQTELRRFIRRRTQRRPLIIPVIVEL